MRLPPRLAALSLTLGLSACTTAGPPSGTPEFAAARVSRAYDCGLPVDRSRVVRRMPREERQRFAMANAAFAVKSYKAPRACDAAERASVQRDLSALAKR